MQINKLNIKWNKLSHFEKVRSRKSKAGRLPTPDFRMPIRSIIKKFSFVICLLNCIECFGQHPKIQNLPKYEFDALHFGFSLGVNKTNFIITPRTLSDSILVVESSPQNGFNLGIVSELAVHRYLTIRFVPNISFAQRNLDFTIATQKGIGVFTKKVESTFLDFPIDIKLRSARMNNFSAYVLAGVKYTTDVASQKNVDNTSLDITQQVVKLDRNDIGYEMGAGVEFYLPYFKFAIEGKLSLGFKNLLVNDNTIFANAIDRLYSKMFLISFTFEG